MKSKETSRIPQRRSSITLFLIGLSLVMTGIIIGAKQAPWWEHSRTQSQMQEALQEIPSSSLRVTAIGHELSAEPPLESLDHQVQIASKAHQNSEFKRSADIREFFGYAQLVQSIRSRTNAQGRFLKVEIYNTDFKYPLIRVAEQWDESRGLSARSAMVADHLLVRWKDEAAAEEIAQFLIQQDAEIRDLDADSRIAIIAFDGLDPRSLVRMLKSFKESPLVESVDPDYLTTNH
jgi:hypothetical protein